ncbi:MAG TPA: L,D-transpeptidase [Verrucomicrobiae bacterium]|jgi:lipoprotein-anchoring transpeptidase ErfK/SrfK|nr:L,D-transpeptidase [Verrucomicrobiae bacterium]
MRRQVAISKRISVAVLVGIISLASARVLADVRQAFSTPHSTFSQSTESFAAKGAADTKQPELKKQQDNDEQLAEQQLSRLAATPSAAQTGDLQDQESGPVRQIVISIPDRQLALLEDGAVVKVYVIAVGKPSTPSPAGEFTVINRATNPTYRHKGQVVLPGKDNPVGTRWMGLSLRGYGIHGTNVQSSIGKAASHGCFRMKKGDVEELFTRVRVGDAVSVRGERDGLTAQLFNSAPASGNEVVQVAAIVPAATADQQ